MAPGLEGAYGALAPAPNTEYGSILPVARDTQTGDMRFAMPASVRDGLKGVLDLANATYTGSLTPEAMQSITVGGLGAGATMAPRGALAAGGSIKAYHSSPYDFDKFDISKVGTRADGGGTTFSRGLYFADLEKATKAYRPPDGKTYEVNLHVQPEQLMNWASPEQSGLVSAATSRLPVPPLRSGQPFGTAGAKIIDDGRGGWLLDTGTVQFPIRHHDIARLFGEEGRALTGGQIYHRAASDIGEQEVVNRLRNSGVKGVQYPDEHRYTGTSNYAIYDDNIIEILRKYGMAAPSPVVPSMNPNPTPEGRRRLAEVLADQRVH
jgi:hypothetical protein